MTPYHLGAKSLRRLQGVHPHLVAVVMLAITLSEQDFSVRCGPRTVAEQQALIESGLSWTMDSDHLPRMSTEPHKVAHAVDLYPYDRDDSEAWKSVDNCTLIAEAMFHAAEILGVSIYWGWAEWKKDAFHFGLIRKRYS